MKKTHWLQNLSSLIFGTSLFTVTTVSAKEATMILPFVGSGYASNSNNEGYGTHFGARILLSANATQRFGLEVSQLDLFSLESQQPSKRFTAIGIVVEQTLWDWFLMSIGTLGYIEHGDNKNRPFGLRTNLGWEGTLINHSIRPFVVYRMDTIFDRSTTRINSLSIGLRWTL